METLEQKILDMKEDETRWNFIESVCYKLPKEIFPPLQTSGIIEDIITRYLSPEKNKKAQKYKKILILEANYKTNLKSHRKVGNPKPYAYEIRFFNKLYNLASVYSENERLNVDMNIYRGRVSFKFKINGEFKTKFFEQDDFFYCPYLGKDKIKTSKGVTIKKLSSLNTTMFGGKSYNFGFENKNNHILILFNNGQIYPFDFDGNFLLPALSSIEAWERKMLVKAQNIEDNMNELDSEEYYNKLVSQTCLEWLFCPENFENLGKYHIIEGTMKGRTCEDGAIYMRFHENGNKIPRINVGRQHKFKEVDLCFKGSFLTIYDLNGKLINGHKFKSIEYHFLKEDTTNLRTLKIKTLPASKELRMMVGPYHYIFSKKPIKKKFGKSIRDFKHVGIMAHTYPGKDCDFEVLLSDGGNLVTEKAIVTSVKKR